MMQMKKFGSVIGLFTVIVLGACGSTNGPTTSSNSDNAYYSYGVVQSIELTSEDTSDKKIGMGTIAGAVVGGIVGNQVGQGRGNTAATIIGAAGGAYAGHQIEKQNQQQSDGYKITIRMTDGSYRSVAQNTAADLRVGDRVQIDNGTARRY
jgi:outer membrane lipoprotein SlyB